MIPSVVTAVVEAVLALVQDLEGAPSAETLAKTITDAMVKASDLDMSQEFAGQKA